MASYHCKLCGLGASSKCVRLRNTFTGDMYASLLTNVLKASTTKRESSREPTYDVNLTFLYTNPNPEVINVVGPENAAIFQALKNLQGLTDEILLHYVCDHIWVLEDDECDLGCCHKEPEISKPTQAGPSED